MLTFAARLVTILSLNLQASLPVPPPGTRDRIRPLDSSSTRLVADGERRSITMASLLDRLEHSPVVVYISADGSLPVRGALTFVSHAGGVTYVLVRIQPMLSGTDGLAALAHELQHAVEVADADGSVKDAAALAALYRRIGFEYGRGVFESAQARATEALVRRELTAATAARAK